MDPVDHLFRHTRGRMISTLTRIFGIQNLELAEDVTQEAFKKALEIWSIRGVPADPSGWLMTTAKNRALDILRREKRTRTLDSEADEGILIDSHLDRAFDPESISGDELRLMFSCCQHSLSEESQVVLILYLLSGFSVKEIASAYITSASAIEKRITRGKRILAESQILFSLSVGERTNERLATVQRSLYLLFNEGYHSSSSGTSTRVELCGEAIRLGALLLLDTRSSTTTTYALLSLMCFLAARLSGRITSEGELTGLLDQDRSQWDSSLTSDACFYLAKSASGMEISEYHVEALIASTHAEANSLQTTDWAQIVSLYDHLLTLKPTPIVQLNRAIAVGQLRGALEGLHAVRNISEPSKLSNYPFYWAALAELEALAFRSEWRAHMLKAVSFARTPQESRYLIEKLKAIDRTLVEH